MESEITLSSVWLFWWVGAQTPLNITAVHLVPERSFINKTVIDSSTKGGPKKGHRIFPRRLHSEDASIVDLSVKTHLGLF